MPNDLKTQRNLLNSRPESRPESRPLSEPQRQKLASSGFTASIWTLSGVVLVACSNVEDFLGIDDGGGGGGGGTLHVHSSPVQGARIYFDVDGGGVSDDEMAAQDARYAEGFISDAEGRVTGVPSEFYGMPFEAHLDGAFDADTGESVGSGILRSIPNAIDGQHLLASPITHHIANQAGDLAAVVGQIDPDASTEAMVNEFLSMVSDPDNYDGRSGIDILARYLDGGQTDAAAEFARVLGDSATVTFAPAPAESAVTISANDEYITTIEVESPASAVQYRIVAGSDAFTVNERGVISVREGMTPTDTTLQISVTNSDGDSEMVSVAVTVADSASTPTLEEVDTGFVTTSIVENVAGADTTGTDLVTGITASSGIAAGDFVIRAPGGFSDKFDVVADGGNWKLVLKDGESLDYEAFSNGEFNVDVWAVEGGVRSNTLTLSVMVTDANNEAPVFIFGTEDNGLVGDGGTIETPESERGTVARVRAHDADGDSVTYEITDGNTGDVFSIDNSGAISVASGETLDYEDTTSYTLTVTATDGGTPALTDTMMLTIDLTDINDVIPTYTTSGDASVRIVTAADNTAGASTGYSITISDADADATNTFGVSVRGDARDRFEFRDQGAGVWELFLKTGETVDEAEGATIALTYTVSDGDNTAETTTAQPGSVSIGVVDSPIRLAGTPYTGTIMEDGTSATLPTIMASVDGASGHRFGYEFVSGGSTTSTDQGFSIGNLGGAITFTGTAGTDLDYEATPDGRDSITLTVRVTYDADGSSNTTDDRETRDVQVVINVGNVEEGEATYEIALTDSTTGATVTDLAVGVTLTPMVATADPDGIDRVVSYLWSRGDGSSLNGDATGATYTLTAGDSTTATYSVTITYMDGTGKTEVVEASTSSVSFDTMPVHDAAMYPLTDGMATMDSYLVIPAAQITASGGDGKIEYSIDRDASSFGNAWFSVNPIDGSILVNEDRPAVWDYETVQTVELVIVATDVDDGSTMGTGDTARIPVTINITDANDAPVVNDALQVNTASGAIGFGSQENLLVRGDDITAMLGSGITPITGATAGDDSALDGTAADEYIYGDAGDDTITGGGGTDHIIGGAGDDGITLASGSVETIYYRFSTAGFAPIASDGADTVTGFRRGEDRIVLLDTDSITPFDRDTLLSDAQNAVIGSSTFSANPLFDVAITEATVKLTGFQIVFDDTFFTINYATDSEVTVRSGGNWLDAAVPYLGALDNMGVPEDFASGAGLRDNSLLLNYFMPSADVLISEKRNAEDGFFATVSATDPDGTAPIMRYDISGGTGMGLFVVNVMGQISVGDGVNVGEGGRTTLDFDTTSEYTLEITATDAGGATSDPTTITIGLIENGEAEYSISKTGDVLTATEDTADPEGLETGSVAMYHWYTTTNGGTNKNYIGTASTANTLDTSISGNEAPTNAVHGVEITYTDGVGIDESIDVRQSTISFTSSDSREYTRAVLDGFITDGDDVGVRILTANIIGTGTAQYAITGGADRAHFSITNTELILNASSTGFPTTQSSFVVEITATDSVTGDADVQTFTVTVTASSPAIIPDRQAFAHQDPYEPNDDQNDQTNQDNPQTPPDIM